MRLEAKSISAILGIVLVLLCGTASASHDLSKGDQHIPYRLKMKYCEALSKRDVVCANMTIQDRKPQLIDTLRVLNLEIAILVYVSAGFFGTGSEHDPDTPTASEYGRKIAECGWSPVDDKGSKIGEDGYIRFDNLIVKCPLDEESRILAELLADYISDRIISTGMWDGILLDGLFEDPTWINHNDGHFADSPR